MARDVAGTILNLSARGLLVKAPRMVPIGTKLVDVRNQPAGKVVDVLGPVASPYLLLALPKNARGSPQPGRDVYLP